MRNLMNRSVAQVTSIVVAVIALVATLCLVMTLQSNYSTQKPDEIPTRGVIQEITYGSSLESASDERPENSAHGNCFITMESGSTHELSLAHCSLNEGDSISLLASTDGGERLAPEYYASEIFTIHMYLILSGTVLLGSLFTLGVLTYRRKSLMELSSGQSNNSESLSLLAGSSN